MAEAICRRQKKPDRLFKAVRFFVLFKNSSALIVVVVDAALFLYTGAG
jgi:hypothetical protein